MGWEGGCQVSGLDGVETVMAGIWLVRGLANVGVEEEVVEGYGC